MASRYPRAVQKPLGAQTEPRMTAHDTACVHTMVGYLATTDAMFSGGGYTGTESTYGIGGKWGADADRGLDGVVWQWQDRRYQADANGPDGNWHVISIETADNAPHSADDIAKWTDKQVSALVDLLAWECSLEAHQACPAGWTCRAGVMWRGIRVAIPPVLIPDSKPSRRGLAYHRLGVKHSQGPREGWWQPGGEVWSLSVGKACPGDRRIAQFKDEVIPAVQARLLGEDDEMPLDVTDKAWIKSTIDDALDPIRASLAALPKNNWAFPVTGITNSDGKELTTEAVLANTFKSAVIAAKGATAPATVSLTPEQVEDIQRTLATAVAAVLERVTLHVE